MIGWLSRVLSRGRHLRWVVADQVVVSGCNFVIAILFARALGPAGFGTYALITVAQQYFVSVSVSLIGNPLTTASPHAQDDRERRQMIEGSFAAQLLAGLALALLGAVGTSLYAVTSGSEFSAWTVLAVAASSFSLPLLEWCRRLCFLQRDGPCLLRADAITYLPVALAACFLVSRDWLTLDVAVLLWAMSSIVACIYAVAYLGMPFRVAGGRAFIVSHWRAARDYLVAFQAQWLGSQGIVYLAAPVVGAAGIGAYRSIGGLLGFANAIGTTLDNVIPLRFAETYRKGGNRALRQSAMRFGGILIALLVLLLVPLGLFARQIVGLLLGDAYVEHSNILWVQAVGVGIVFASRIMLYHERARLRTRPLALSATLGAVVSIVLVFPAATALGPVGVAWSTTLGSAIALSYLCVCVFRAGKSG